jgi:hypothetical protein
LKIVTANADEMAAHDAMLDKMKETGACLWHDS